MTTIVIFFTMVVNVVQEQKMYRDLERNKKSQGE